MDELTANKKKLLTIRIVTVSAIILLIAGIFVIKSFSDKTEKGSAANEGGLTVEHIPLAVSQVDLETLKSYKLPMVIDFGSDSCIPCQQMAPVLVTLNEEWQGKAIVQFVDVWKYTDAANYYPVSVIPTQVFFNADGTPYVPSESMQQSMEFMMYTLKTTGEHVFTTHQGGLTEDQMRLIFAEMGVE